MTYDRSKLRGRIVEKYGTVTKFAEVIGKSKVTVCNKLNNRRRFTEKDFVLWMPALDIPAEQLPDYFFKIKV